DPLPGAVVSVDQDPVGITGSGDFFDGPGLLVTFLASGDHVAGATITISRVDVDGVQQLATISSESAVTLSGGETASVEFSLDTRAPVVTIDSPAAGTTNNPEPLLDYNSTEAGEEIVLRDNLPILQRAGEILPEFSDGTHAIKVLVEDATGNVGDESVTFLVDTIDPAVTIALYNDADELIGENAVTDTKEPVLDYTVTDANAASVSVTVTLDGQTVDVASGGLLPSLSDGQHTVAVTAVDEAGNSGSGSFSSISFTVDTAAPIVEIDSPLDGEVTSDTQPVVNVTVTDATATTLTATLDGQDLSDFVSGYTLPLLSDGGHTVVVTAVDEAGNSESVSISSISFTVDTVAPLVGIASPVNGAITNNIQPVLEFTVTDATATTVTVMIVGGEELPGFVSGDTLPLTFDGEYSVVVTAVDEAGNPGSDDVTFILDTEAPVVTISSPANGSYLNTQTPTLTFSSDEGGTAQVTVNDGSNDIDSFTASIAAGEIVSATLGPLPDGLFTVTVTVTDFAGGNSGSDEISFTIDTGMPGVQIYLPVEGSSTNDTTPALSFSSDEAGTVDVTVDGLDIVYTNTFGAAISAGEIIGATLGPLEDGTYQVTVSVTDAAFNTTEVAVSFTVDTQDPVVTIDSPTAGTSNNPTPQLSYSSNENGIVDVTLNGNTIVVANGDLLGPLSDGEYTLTVILTDAAGNTGGNSVTFVVDTTAPVLSITSPLDESFLNTSSPSLVFSTDEQGSGVVTVVGDGYSDSFGVGLPSGETANRLLGPLADGAYQLWITFEDDAGNTRTTNTVDFTIDTVLPVVTITSPVGDTNDPAPQLLYTSSETGTESVTLNGAAISTRSGGFLDLQAGSYDLIVKVEDLAGNAGSDSVSFTVNLTSPVVTITAPANGDFVATDTPGIVFSSNEDGTAVVSAPGATSQSLSVTAGITASATIGSLGEGSNTVTVTVTDAVGNTGTGSVFFIVDTIDPVVTISVPIGPTYEREPILEYTSSEPGTERVWLDNVEIPTRSGETLPRLDDGDHTVVVEVTDAAGNTGSRSAIFSVTIPEPVDFFEIEASRTKRPTVSTPGTIELTGPVTVQIPSHDNITVLAGNPNRFMLHLKLGDVDCVYLGGKSGDDNDDEIQSPICEWGQYRAGDVITIEGEIKMRVLNADPKEPLTHIKMRIDVVD
ncbi:MAG: Ig-like domain repeat protein, partial [SAR324 cluster bacterium]|nr:Ig-like domain repeat protein [SAR324 cluster bacterium]